MGREIKIAPSILSADLTNLGDAIRILNEGGADLVHFDVMDGHFVPNITFGPAFANELKKVSKIPFDTHLMVSHPMQYGPKFAESSDWLTFHIEADDDPNETIALFKDLGVKVGISINPGTPFSDIEKFIPQLDLILIMTVEPGFGGQKCMTEHFSKLTDARNLVEKLGQDTEIMVDGGVTEHNVAEIVRAGASSFVAGSAVFRGTRGPVEEIRVLKENALKGLE